MVQAFTSTPRESQWLRTRLKTLTPSLPVFPYSGNSDAGRHIVYTRQGGTDIVNLAGTYLVRSAWLVYVSQPVEEGERWYIEDLATDADRMHAAIYKPHEVQAVNGLYIEECRRDFEHSPHIFDDDGNLVELQLGGLYVILTSRVT
jgi:hypothetical protein